MTVEGLRELLSHFPPNSKMKFYTKGLTLWELEGYIDVVEVYSDLSDSDPTVFVSLGKKEDNHDY